MARSAKRNPNSIARAEKRNADNRARFKANQDTLSAMGITSYDKRPSKTLRAVRRSTDAEVLAKADAHRNNKPA